VAAAFWDQDRYQAARVCYKYMRAIDDMIDCHKSTHGPIADSERIQFLSAVDEWLAMARDASAGRQDNHELMKTIREFHIPVWPLEAFARSMVYDIDHNGFETIDSFITYAQGASVAPASIFVHLSGLRRNGNQFSPPPFDVRWAATPCAIFSYLVHIIRDFQKDQQNNLTYFADDAMVRNGITAGDLKEMGNGAPISAGFRAMIREYMEMADKYRNETNQVIREIWPSLEPRYRLSLQIIFNLYLMVFERIDPEKGNFTGIELNPTPAEIRTRVESTILSFR
jgi:phytoene/squalene synthetase